MSSTTFICNLTLVYSKKCTHKHEKDHEGQRKGFDPGGIVAIVVGVAATNIMFPSFTDERFVTAPHSQRFGGAATVMRDTNCNQNN